MLNLFSYINFAGSIIEYYSYLKLILVYIEQSMKICLTDMKLLP